MSNPINVFDIPGQTLAQFLATPVDDGTWEDVLGTLKIDNPGEEASATEIELAAGQFWSNMVDDYIKATYPLVKGITASLPPRKQTITTQVITGVDTALVDLLAFSPVSESLRLFLNGVEQEEGTDYSIAGTTITWLAGSGTAVNMDTADRLTAYYQG
jgi:hypothetical protein